MGNAITNIMSQQHFSSRKQSGAMLIMFTIGLFSLLAVTALAIDGSHLLLSKSRLQNIVDSSALNSAKKISDGGSLFDARQAAVALIEQNLAFNQNRGLLQNINLAAADYNSTQVSENIVIEFSELPDPFMPSLAPANQYVRVRIESVNLPNFLADVLGFNKDVRASAVAGPSTDIACNTKLVPMMVCADQLPDGTYVAPPALELYVMKLSSQEDDTLGPGNFQLLDYGVSNSEITTKEALAGGYNSAVCVSPGDLVDTLPGNKVNDVAAGLNMRLGIQTPGQGNMSEYDYPPDVNTCVGTPIAPDDSGNIAATDAAAAYRFSAYQNSLTGAGSQCLSGGLDLDGGVGGRREMEVVIGKCDGLTNGKQAIEVIDTGCFLLTQEVEHKGNKDYVIGEFSATCSGAGNASLEPTHKGETHTIVLYRDPDSPDS